MNKAEIICYILSAYFFGISTGSFIAVGVHNAIYRDKKIKPIRLKWYKRLFRRPRQSAILRDIDEVHKWPTDSGMMLGTDRALAALLSDPEYGEQLRRELTKEAEQ